MGQSTQRSKCEILHGVLYPNFQRHCLGLVTEDGDDYDIQNFPNGRKLIDLLYEPVRVIGKLNKNRSGLKVINLEAENEPPELDGASVQTTAVPTHAYA